MSWRSLVLDLMVVSSPVWSTPYLGATLSAWDTHFSFSAFILMLMCPFLGKLTEETVVSDSLRSVSHVMCSSDLDAAKRLQLGTLVVARRLNLKADLEEACCLRLQHLSSLQAALT